MRAGNTIGGKDCKEKRGWSAQGGKRAGLGEKECLDSHPRSGVHKEKEKGGAKQFINNFWGL